LPNKSRASVESPNTDVDVDADPSWLFIQRGRRGNHAARMTCGGVGCSSRETRYDVQHDVGIALFRKPATPIDGEQPHTRRK